MFLGIIQPLQKDTYPLCILDSTQHDDDHHFLSFPIYCVVFPVAKLVLIHPMFVARHSSFMY